MKGRCEWIDISRRKREIRWGTSGGGAEKTENTFSFFVPLFPFLTHAALSFCIPVSAPLSPATLQVDGKPLRVALVAHVNPCAADDLDMPPPQPFITAPPHSSSWI